MEALRDIERLGPFRIFLPCADAQTQWLGFRRIWQPLTGEIRIQQRDLVELAMAFL